MANGIPPFLPASPPPMCKLDYYDDDDDDFGGFPNATENCYQDDVSVTKSIADEEVSYTSQVFDPGANCKHSNETSIHDQEYSFGDFVRHDESTSPFVEDEPVLEKEVSKTDNTSEIHDTIENGVLNDAVEQNYPNTEPVEELSDENPRVCLNDEDNNSADESTGDDFDQKLPKNQTISSIFSDNDFRCGSPIVDDTTKIEAELPDNHDFILPENGSTIEDDFSAFCCVSEPKEIIANHTNNSKEIESHLQRAFSEDSDDSNTPDIDFNCFITNSQDLDNYQSNINLEDFDGKQCEDDFGDFANPVEVDYNVSQHISPSFPLDENIESNNEMYSNSKAITQVTIDQPVDVSTDFIDDDFSDFVSTTTPPAIVNSDNSNSESIDFFSQSKSSKMYQLDADSPEITSNQENFSRVATNPLNVCLENTFDLNSECWNEIFQVSGEEQIEVNLNTFESKLNGSSIWCKIKDFETSPALSYNWNNSETQKVLLAALYVDSRNILFGPRWNSDVPRFASNLGFSPLVPEKASEKKDIPPISVSPQTVQREDTVVDDNAPKVPTSVPDAHFDWNNSGLTNPLDNHSHSALLDLDLLASFDIHSPYYKNNRKNERTKGNKSSTYENSLLAKTPVHKELSEEAKDILKNLPNLYVMEKQYIVFPVS